MAQPQQRYRILEKIAVGGMAEVFRAESAGLEGFKKTVAIKRVLPHLSEKKQFIGMFLDEARVSAHLSHSNCVHVFDVGVGDNSHFIVMEFVDGADLKAVIEAQRQRGLPLAVEEACLISVRICEGLSYAHELVDGRGAPLHIVHRDMSPPNVLVTRYGEVKIVDFGLAKANSQLERSEPGIIKGKFSYLSPEAAWGRDVDARTDIFAVGIILWEMLAGRRLFLGETDLDTVRQVQAAKIPSVRQLNPKVPPQLDAVIAKALAGDPAQRYQSARALGRDLNDILFRFPRAVSSFDIAALVEPIRVERERKRRQTERGSLIGTLIEEAMVEFTSLDAADSSRPSSRRGAAPLRMDSFEQVGDWAKDLDLAHEARGPESGLSYSLGNLAALEDEAPGPGIPAARRPPPPRSAPQAAHAPPSGRGAQQPPPASHPAASQAFQHYGAQQQSFDPSAHPDDFGTRPSQAPHSSPLSIGRSSIAEQGRPKSISLGVKVGVAVVVLGAIVAAVLSQVMH